MFLETTKVKEHLLEGSDYKLINEEGWNELVKWFGIVEGQEPIKRYVIEHGLFTKDTQVEIYPLHLQLCLFKNLEKLVSKYISKTTTLGKIKNFFGKFCKFCKISYIILVCFCNIFHFN